MHLALRSLMDSLIRPFLAACMLCVSTIGMAEAQSSSPVSVTQAWVRATVPQQKATGAFMQLQASENSKLVAAHSTMIEHVEIHEMSMTNNVMKMRQVKAIELPAGQKVDLKPGGYHIMLMNLQQPLNAGDTVPLSLVFENTKGERSTLQINASVRPLNASNMPSTHMGHDKPQAHQH